MRRAAIVLSCAALFATVGPVSSVATAGTPKLKLSISNFRYCEAESCTPLDVGYLRSSDGPVMGADNPEAVIEVKRGTVVSWIYRDMSCDDFGCPGHNVVYENGTPQGVRKGFVASGQQGKAITAKITEKPGTTIRYFCSVNNHYEQGMTGILQVVE